MWIILKIFIEFVTVSFLFYILCFGHKACGNLSSLTRNWTRTPCIQFSSVQFNRSVVFNSLWPHESQHARPPCPSPTPGVCPNPCPSSRWCHPAISSSAVTFSSCPQTFPASGSFPVSQLFAWGDQSIGVSASTSVLPVKTQDWSPRRINLKHWTAREVFLEFL